MKLGISFVALVVPLSAARLAAAQPPEPLPSTYIGPEKATTDGKGPLGAPKNALELSVATGYTQPFGSLRSGVGMPSVATPGLGVDVGVGYRIDPRWAVLVSGQYQELTAERSSSARGLATSIGVQYHFAPKSRLDPWAEVGAGYRFLWELPATGPTLLTHGLELGRVRVGLDFRADEALSLGPMIGADADLFLFQNVPGVQTNIADPRLSTFVYAGLQGRFDIGGSTGSGARVVATR